MQPRDDSKQAQVAAQLCPSCEGAEFTCFEVPERGLTVKVCQSCGLYINAGLPTAEEEVAAGAYDQEYHARLYGRVAARKTKTGLLRMLWLEDLCPPRKLLDVGCSLGYLVEAAAQRGWEAWGVDISPDAVRACQERGLQVKPGDMQHLEFSDDSFNAIYLRHVLEHDRDLGACLTEIGRVLAPGGLVMIEVPCVDCHQVQRGRERYRKFWHTCHCYWFSRRALRQIMHRAGFDGAPLPAYGRRVFAEGLPVGLHYLLWRTHMMLKRRLGWAAYEISAWKKAG